MFWLCCRRPAAWRAICPKSYYAAVGCFACALLTPYKPSFTREKKPGSAFCVARSPWKATSPKILLRHGRIFCLCPAHALQAIPHHRKEAGKRVLCSQVSWKATSPKILLRHGRIFCLCPAHALQATLHHRKVAGKRVLCSQVSSRPSAKILLRHGRIFCLCPAHALQAIPRHRKEAGKRVLCSQARQKADCSKILLRRGRNFLGGPCLPHSLSIFASPALLQ